MKPPFVVLDIINCILGYGEKKGLQTFEAVKRLVYMRILNKLNGYIFVIKVRCMAMGEWIYK